MAYRRFRLNCVLRVVLLGVTICLFFFVLFRTRLYTASFLLGLLIIYETFSLIHYVEKINRDLSRFFQSIKYGDFSQTFVEKRADSSFKELRTALTEVTAAFRKARSEKEEHFRYLQTVVQHVGVGLIAFQPNGDVDLINSSARRLLKVGQLKNIRALEKYSEFLVRTLFELKPRERALVKVEDGDELLQLALYATEFKLRDQKYTLVSIQNIQVELEEREIEAWQKLIRVLTHEIMNSITPISSLASTVSELVSETCRRENLVKEDMEQVGDIQLALQTIQKRSQGLLHFVNAYRNLTRIPKPNFQIFTIGDLFRRIEQLMHARFASRSIDFQTQIEPSSLELVGDPELIEQVLINLLLNAFEAVEGLSQARVYLTARLDGRGRTVLQVKDNGPGIPKENLDKIFVPFFSTKEGGSGIGLSLSRQIMRLHNGTIGVTSEPNVETSFTLRF